MDDFGEVLRSEFEAAGDDSFLILLRNRLTWDRAAFTRLVTAMRACCEAHQGRETVERWMAEGFWYLSHFVREWSTHPRFPREHEPEYYEEAYRRLDDLAYWFFVGESPYEDGAGFEPL